MHIVPALSGIACKAPPGDDHLLHAFRHGDEKAFRSIFKLYYTPLVFFANKLINDLPAAEDITADSFYKLNTGRNSYASLPHIKAFLYMATRNACIDFIAARHRHQASHRELWFLPNVTAHEASPLVHAHDLVERHLHLISNQ